MCLNIDAGGFSDGKGTHYSIFLYLMQGKHDDAIHWPLNMKFKLTLLNQLSDSQHTYVHFSEADHNATHRVLARDMASTGWGSSCFVSHEHLSEVTPTRQFLKDDCIFVSITRP